MRDKVSIMDVLSDAIKDEENTENNTSNAIMIRDELIEKLESGKLKATGITPNGNRPQPINASEWISIKSLNEFIGALLSNAVGTWDETLKYGIILFRQVWVSREDALRLWPTDKRETKPKKNYSENEIREFLSSKINENDRYISIV